MPDIGTGTHVFAVCRSNCIKDYLRVPIMRRLWVIMDTYLDLITVGQLTDYWHTLPSRFGIDYLNAHRVGNLEDLCPFLLGLTVDDAKCTDFHSFFLQRLYNRVALGGVHVIVHRTFHTASQLLARISFHRVQSGTNGFLYRLKKRKPVERV